jgi:hypothetical protein
MPKLKNWAKSRLSAPEKSSEFMAENRNLQAKPGFQSRCFLMQSGVLLRLL